MLIILFAKTIIEPYKVATTSLNGKYIALTTDVGTHLVLDAGSMQVRSHMDTSGKLTAPPYQSAFISTSNRIVLALHWHHLLLIFDEEKSWYADDKIMRNDCPKIFQEIDGIRMITGRSHKFLSVAESATSDLNNYDSASDTLVQSYKFFINGDVNAEAYISG